MIKEFNRIEEIEKYYEKETNSYVFKEKGEYIDEVVFNFDLDTKANIKANDINAYNIIARNISSRNIDAYNIMARKIDARDIKTWDIKANKIKAYNLYSYDISSKYINAWDIKAWNIRAIDIEATDIKATSIDTEFRYAHSIIASDIIARHISYYTVCFADKMKYTSITNRRENSTSFMLDNNAIINEDEYRVLNQISK